MDHLADSPRLVGAEIVHDNNVAWLQDGDELLLDIGLEAASIDRSVEDAGRGEPVGPQCAEEGQRAPVTMRGKAAHALALRSPASQRGHIGFDPRFVDKDQSTRIKATLPGAPASAPTGDVSAGLLKGEQRFF